MLGFCLLFFSCQIIIAQQLPIVRAKKKEFSETEARFWHNVEVIWQDYQFYADYVEYNFKTKEMYAQGRVTICSEDTVVSGEKLRFNFGTRSGEMSDTQGLMQPTVRYHAKIWRQTDNDTQVFKKMDFSSCPQCNPIWKITCTKGTIKREKYIDMKNVVLRIKNIPVFYLPFLRYPLHKDGKSSGFLFPIIKPVDKLFGPSIRNSFFWNIKPHLDLTLYQDTYFDLGIGLGEEFRYLFKHSTGNLKLYTLKYKEGNIFQEKGEQINIDELEYYFRFRHRSKFDFLNTTININVDQMSSTNILSILDRHYSRARSKRFRSSVNITSRLSNIQFNIRGEENKIVAIHDDSYSTITYLPVMRLNLNRQKIWKIPGVFSIRTRFDNIKREKSGDTLPDEDSIYKSTDNFNRRIDVTPSYTLKLLQLPWLGATLSMDNKHSFYNKSKDPDTGEELNEPLHLQYNLVRLRLNGPVIYKIFQSSSHKIKHVIEPQIDLRYASTTQNMNRLLQMDRFDLPPYSRISFSLNSRLFSKARKEGASVTEILVFSISQDYYFDEILANPYGTVKGVYPEFSEISNNIRFKLGKFVTLRSRISYNHYTGDFSQINLRLNYNNPNSFINGSIAYRRIKRQHDLARNPFAMPIFSSSVNLNIPSFPIKINSVVDYDLENNNFRYLSTLATLDLKCLSIYVDYQLRYSHLDAQIVPEFSIGFNFGNLGRVKDFLQPQGGGQ